MDLIVSGLQRLCALSLAGTPPDETIVLTAQTWADALWQSSPYWDLERDSERITKGFTQLILTCDRWPTPAQLRAVLPSRAPQLALPEPPMSDEQKQRNRERLRVIVETLAQRKTNGSANES